MREAVQSLLGVVSGFVVQAEGEPVLYIAGDTIWCSEVERALQQFSPDVVILKDVASK